MGFARKKGENIKIFISFFVDLLEIYVKFKNKI